MNRTNEDYIKSGMNRLEGSKRHLTLKELYDLAKYTEISASEAVVKAFYMGVETGARHTEKERRARG